MGADRAACVGAAEGRRGGLAVVRSTATVAVGAEVQGARWPSSSISICTSLFEEDEDGVLAGREGASS